MESVVFSSKAYKKNAKRVEQLWSDCGDMMYSLTPKCRQLGLGEQVSDFATTVLIFLPSGERRCDVMIVACMSFEILTWESSRFQLWSGH